MFPEQESGEIGTTPQQPLAALVDKLKYMRTYFPRLKEDCQEAKCSGLFVLVISKPQIMGVSYKAQAEGSGYQEPNVIESLVQPGKPQVK